MCQLQKFIALRFASAHWCLWKLNWNNRKICFGDASLSRFSYQANLPCIKQIWGLSRMWPYFQKKYLTYFDRLVLSNELPDKQSKLKREDSLTWLEHPHKRPQPRTCNCSKAFGRQSPSVQQAGWTPAEGSWRVTERWRTDGTDSGSDEIKRLSPHSRPGISAVRTWHY